MNALAYVRVQILISSYFSALVREVCVLIIFCFTQNTQNTQNLLVIKILATGHVLKLKPADFVVGFATTAMRSVSTVTVPAVAGHARATKSAYSKTFACVRLQMI